MYITPLLYAIFLLLFKLYISVPFVIFFYLFISHTEKEEIKKMSNRFHISKRVELKLSNKYIIIVSTFLIMISLLGYMYYRFV